MYPSPRRTSHPTMASTLSHTASSRQTCTYITHHGTALVHTHAELHAACPPMLTQILAHRYKRACAPRPELTDTETGRHCHKHRGWSAGTRHNCRAARPGAHTLTQVLPQGPRPSRCWHSECGRRSHGSCEGSEPAPRMLPAPERCAYHPPPSSSAAGSQAGTAVIKLFRQFTALITPDREPGTKAKQTWGRQPPAGDRVSRPGLVGPAEASCFLPSCPRLPGLLAGSMAGQRGLPSHNPPRAHTQNTLGTTYHHQGWTHAATCLDTRTQTWMPDAH